jgi:hypothetical protein
MGNYPVYKLPRFPFVCLASEPPLLISSLLFVAPTYHVARKMSGLADTKYNEKSAGDDVMREKSIGGHHAEILENKDLMTDAQNAEAREHEMGLWEAVKDHPMACFWAFIFCFTIVSQIFVD